MLAQKGEPLDSEEHLFEIKWDGTRMLAIVEGDGYRLVNRHRAERTAQYPDLACLTDLLRTKKQGVFGMFACAGDVPNSVVGNTTQRVTQYGGPLPLHKLTRPSRQANG